MHRHAVFIIVLAIAALMAFAVYAGDPAVQDDVITAVVAQQAVAAEVDVDAVFAEVRSRGETEIIRTAVDSYLMTNEYSLGRNEGDLAIWYTSAASAGRGYPNHTGRHRFGHRRGLARLSG